MNLSNGNTAGGDAVGDNLTTIEGIYGSEFNDILTGNGATNVIRVGRGTHSVDLGEGDDLLIVDYSSNTFAGTATYATGLTFNAYSRNGTGTYGNGSAYRSATGILDTIEFSGADTLIGGAGNDTLHSGNSTNPASEKVDGGLGFDIAQFANLSTLKGNVFDNTSKAVEYGGATFVGLEASKSQPLHPWHPRW